MNPIESNSNKSEYFENNWLIPNIVTWLNNFANSISLPLETITFQELEYALIHPKEDPILGDIFQKLMHKDKVRNMLHLKQEYGNDLKSAKHSDILAKLKKYRIAQNNYDWPEYSEWDIDLEKHLTKLHNKYVKIKEHRERGLSERIDKNVEDLLMETYFDLLGGRNPYYILKSNSQRQYISYDNNNDKNNPDKSTNDNNKSKGGDFNNTNFESINSKKDTTDYSSHKKDKSDADKSKKDLILSYTAADLEKISFDSMEYSDRIIVLYMLILIKNEQNDDLAIDLKELKPMQLRINVVDQDKDNKFYYLVKARETRLYAMNTEVVKFAPPKKIRLKMDNRLVINQAVYDREYFESKNEGRPCSNHKIPFNDVDLVAKDTAVFQRIMERFSNSQFTYEQNIANAIDNKIDEIYENDKITPKVAEKREKRIKSMYVRRAQVERQREQERVEREKQKELKALVDKKKHEKDPITKIQKVQEQRRKATEAQRKERYEKRLEEVTKPKKKSKRQSQTTVQNGSQHTTVKTRRAKRDEFEIVMIGRIIIDRDRNIIKHSGKWHMEPGDNGDENAFYYSKAANDVEELSIENLSGKFEGYFEHDSNRIKDFIHFTLREKADTIYLKGQGKNSFGAFFIRGEGEYIAKEDQDTNLIKYRIVRSYGKEEEESIDDQDEDDEDDELEVEDEAIGDDEYRANEGPDRRSEEYDNSRNNCLESDYEE